MFCAERVRKSALLKSGAKARRVRPFYAAAMPLALLLMLSAESLPVLCLSLESAFAIARPLFATRETQIAEHAASERSVAFVVVPRLIDAICPSGRLIFSFIFDARSRHAACLLCTVLTSR